MKEIVYLICLEVAQKFSSEKIKKMSWFGKNHKKGVDSSKELE